MGQPTTCDGTVPNRFFSDSVAPAQWCVFSFGIDTTMSAPSTCFDTGSRPSPVKSCGASTSAQSSTFRSVKRA